MTVADAIKTLEAVEDKSVPLVICAHEFEGMEDQGWFASHLDLTESDTYVLIEGAAPKP